MKIECTRDQVADMINTYSVNLSEEAAVAVADYYGAHPELVLSISALDETWGEMNASDLIFDQLSEGEIEAHYDSIPPDEVPDWEAAYYGTERYYGMIAALEDTGKVVLEVEVDPNWHGDSVLLVIGSFTD